MAARLLVLIGVTACLTLGGCVFPKRLGGKGPFRPAVIGFIEPGATTGDEVETTLGTPLYTFSDGRWWAYCAHRRNTEWGWFMLAQENVIGGAFGGDTDQQSLVLQFDENDIVDDVIVIKADDGCTRRGRICHKCGFLQVVEDGKRITWAGTLGNDPKRTSTTEQKADW